MPDWETLKAMVPEVELVMVVTVLLPPLQAAEALALAPETLQWELLVQVLLTASLRFSASVLLVPLRTTQGALQLLLPHVYVVPPMVIVSPAVGSPEKVTVPVVAAGVIDSVFGLPLLVL